MAAANAPAPEEMAQILENHEANKKTTTIPVFYGTSKDTITGKNLIKRINQAANIATWNDQRKLNELINAVRNQAQDDLDAILETYPGEKNWTNVCKAFLDVYDPQGTEKASCTLIADLHQKTGESENTYYSRVNTHFRKIRDNRPARTYTSSEDLINAAPPALRDQIRADGKRISDLCFGYMHQLLYTAGLSDNLRHKVMEKACNELWESHKYAAELEIIQSDKDKKAKVNAVRTEEDEDRATHQKEDSQDLDLEYETEEEFHALNAMRARRGLPARPRPRFFRRSNSAAPTNGFANGNNGSKKDFRCRYCKKTGHSQTECRKRIREGGLCVDEAGKPWKNQPKVNDIKDQAGPATLNSFRNL